MHHIDALIGQWEVLRRAVQNRGVGQRQVAHPVPRQVGQRLVRFDPHHAGCGLGEPCQVEATATADVQDPLTLPVVDAGHGRLDQPVGVNPAVLDLIDVRVVPDVRARDRSLER